MIAQTSPATQDYRGHGSGSQRTPIGDASGYGVTLFAGHRPPREPYDSTLSRPLMAARGKSRAGAKNGDCHQFAHHSPRNKVLSLKRIGWLYPIFPEVCVQTLKVEKAPRLVCILGYHEPNELARFSHQVARKVLGVESRSTSPLLVRVEPWRRIHFLVGPAPPPCLPSFAVF